jgi:uncharacterized protein (TIGR04255 family)
MSETIPQPPYPKAPIIESVIHLAVEGKATGEQLQKLMKRFAKDYPQQETVSSVSVAINTTGGAMTVQQQIDGYRLKSADQADILMLFPNGVAAARLAPYPGWESLRDRAHVAWAEWRKSTGYGVLNRIGVRYINRIDIAIEGVGSLDIETYLNFGARVPEFSKFPMGGFLLQITKPTELEHWSTSITATIASPPPLVNHLSLILDIDVFRTEQIPGRDADLWDCIDAARPLKNAIFQSCITDEARKLFA